MFMINSCVKGKVVERALVDWLKEHGIASARRTEQYNGAEGISDVIADVELSHWHIESKGCKKALLTCGTLKDWYGQVERDCPSDLKPVIFVKSNNKELIALFRHEEVMDLSAKAAQFLFSVEESFIPTLHLDRATRTHKFYEAIYGKKPLLHVAGFEYEEGKYAHALDAETALKLMLKYESSFAKPIKTLGNSNAAMG